MEDAQNNNGKMRMLIMEIDKYLLAQTEDRALSINRYLQAFSETTDINVFEPDTNIGVKFFVSLYQLFNKIDPQSQMAWYCVDILTNACRNTSAKSALMNTYNFIPTLSRLLSDQLSLVKQEKLLKLMQDISSAGVKMSWQMSHLPQLFQTLTKFVESNEKEIVCWSLGVLVNLCHQNLPAIHTLTKSVDIKNFLRICLSLQGPLIEIQVCKFMLILDDIQTDMAKVAIERTIELTFSSLFEAFKNNDVNLLRQTVVSFSDTISNYCKDIQILKEYNQYEQQVGSLLHLVENNVKDNSSESKSTSKDQNNPECISLLLEFIHYLMEHDIEALIHLYPKINKLAIDWVNSERVSFQALAVLTKVVQKATEAEDDNNNRELLQVSVAALPAFMLIFPSNVMPCNMESCRRLGALMQLFRVMLQSSSIRPNVLQVLKKDMVRKVFIPLESDNLNVEWLPNLKSHNGNMTSTDALNTYLYGLGLINELVQYDASWLDLQSTLMENRKIHMIIAQALYGGTSDVRCVALEICRHGSLPIKKVASAMGTLQPIFTSDFDASSRTSLNKAHYSVLHMGISTLSFGQMGRLEDILHQIKRLIDENKMGNITTSQVMELYEYKLATLAYAEWSFLSSIEAATERCTQLQHRLAEITVEQNKFKQLLFHSEQCLQQTEIRVRRIC